MSSNITICSVVNNDEKCGLFDLMVRSVLKFTDGNPKFVIYDTQKGNNLDKYENNLDFTIVRDDRVSGSSGSLEHGESLNKIFNDKYVKTRDFAIIEPDCIILNNGWNEIGYPKYKLVAANKDTSLRKVYHMCFLVGSARLLLHGKNIDFRPGNDKNRSSRSYKVHEDVGWAMHERIRSAGGKVKPIDFVDCKTGKGKFFDKTFQSDEFWVDGVPVAAHLGRGSNLKGKKVRKGFEHPKEQLKEWKKIAEEILK